MRGHITEVMDNPVLANIRDRGLGHRVKAVTIREEKLPEEIAPVLEVQPRSQRDTRATSWTSISGCLVI